MDDKENEISNKLSIFEKELNEIKNLARKDYIYSNVSARRELFSEIEKGVNKCILTLHGTHY